MASLRVGVTTGEEERIRAYMDRVREAGLEPVVVNKPGQTIDGLAGLVLTGGVDVSPSLYGEEPHSRTQEPDPLRDDVEFSVLRQALEADLPVLAICRGIQVLNVTLGGTLLQHIEDWSHVPLRDHAEYDKRTSAQHGVKLGGYLVEIYGADELQVNSRHHQAVTPDRLAPGLEVTAVTDDGLVEGVIDPSKRWVVGVQWHPERLEPHLTGFAEQSRNLFAAFAAAVKNAPPVEATAAPPIR
jgi:gamma-glutamyl-gamma-aminobutyrate hydrolase PuuD